ncbi:MAG: transposase [bacterium]
MPRVARIMIENIPYHVTQRGNRREDIFFGDEDRKRYLEWLKVYSERYGLKIEAYCLMTNHIHLVVVSCHKDSLRKDNAFIAYEVCHPHKSFKGLEWSPLARTIFFQCS